MLMMVKIWFNVGKILGKYGEDMVNKWLMMVNIVVTWGIQDGVPVR